MDHLLSKENVTCMMASYIPLANKRPIKINLVSNLLLYIILFSFERLCQEVFLETLLPLWDLKYPLMNFYGPVAQLVRARA